jgi:hypothetical protein
MMRKVILHLCADLGSDSRYFQLDDNYDVIMVGIDIGVENFTPPSNVHGIIANPKCTEFSNANHTIKRDPAEGMVMVDHCLRIIAESNPVWWVIENPARGTLKDYLGKPDEMYQPWEYGSPWTKHTALWGSFKMPDKLYTDWEDCPKNPNIYTRPGRPKPSLAFLHKSAVAFMPEYAWCMDRINCDADIRSLCSDGFAREFYLTQLSAK